MPAYHWYALRNEGKVSALEVNPRETAYKWSIDHYRVEQKD
jgi:hypothetical protein